MAARGWTQAQRSQPGTHGVPGKREAQLSGQSSARGGAALSSALAEVTFRRAHDASGNAVHGGLLPLVYDDVLGRLAARATPMLARTAYLHVDYRAVTPIGRPLVVEGGIEQLEGRKILAWGRMTDGDNVLTTARALFVIARSD